MKVSLELFKGKTLVDGSNPIVIRISNQGKNKYKSIGISTKERFWNKDKKCLTCRATNYKLKNRLITDEFNRISNRCQWFKDNNFDLDFNYIFGNDDLENYMPNTVVVEEFNSNNFIDIIRARVEACGKMKTREHYQAFYNTIKRIYGEFIDIRTINQYFMNTFRNKIDEEFPNKGNLKNHLIKCFNSSYKFGVANRWIKNPYLYEIKKFPYKPQNRDITNEEFSQIINCYKKKLDGNWDVDEYKGLALFILDVAFQGLAPIDLAKIKIKDLKFGVIKKEEKNFELYLNDFQYRQNFDSNQEFREVIKIDTFRQKTGNSVPICTDYYSIRPILAYFCNNKSGEDYLIDCFKISRDYTEKQISNRCGNYFMQMSDSLNKTMVEYCHTIDVPSFKKITYYYARHAFVNRLDKMDISHDLIRKMVGHKDKTLERSYISKPTDWEQAEVISKIFNDVKSIPQLEIESKGKIKANSDWDNLRNFLISLNNS